MDVTNVIDKERTLAPKLRFKGFDVEWEKKTLFEVSENVSYGMNAAATDYDGMHKYIRITDIDVNSGEFKPNPLTSPQGEIDEKFKLKKGDIVFARTGASVGKSYLYNPKDGALYYAGFLIKFSITKAIPYLIYSLTLKEDYYKWVQVYSMRSGQPGLNAEEYKRLKFNIPSIPEQQKIASFLSAVDEKIQQLTRKKELLEQYKKGVMQQLFSGKLRFRDENKREFPKWTEKRIGEILEEKFEKTEKSNEYRILSSTKKGLFNQDEYFTRDIASKDNTGYKILRRNELVFSPQNLWLGNINVNLEFEIGVVSPSYKIFSFNEKFTNAKFCKYFLLTSKMIYAYKQASVQGASVVRRNLDMEKFFNIKLKLPCLIEQKKITTFIENIDSKIENVNIKISQTQIFKKGLLQQMFV